MLTESYHFLIELYNRAVFPPEGSPNEENIFSGVLPWFRPPPSALTTPSTNDRRPSTSQEPKGQTAASRQAVESSEATGHSEKFLVDCATAVYGDSGGHERGTARMDRVLPLRRIDILCILLDGGIRVLGNEHYLLRSSTHRRARWFHLWDTACRAVGCAKLKAFGQYSRPDPRKHEPGKG